MEIDLNARLRLTLDMSTHPEEYGCSGDNPENASSPACQGALE